jgi:lipopolysaccharide transport system ATP-binding protein
MSFDSVLEVIDLAKTYRIYQKPLDRLKQIIVGNRKRFYTDFVALSNVSFELKKGETVGIVGRNGAGKSTLLQLITGVLSPTHGNITVRGKIAALLELGAGFNPEFTGRENVYMAASIYGLSESEIDERIQKIIDFSGVSDFIDQPIKTYSSGMFIRLAFSVISNVDADILVVDEALAVGDVVFQQRCLRYLEAFKTNGGTILFVSHDISMVSSLCSRVVYLKKVENNHVVTVGNTGDICKIYLEDTYADIEKGRATSDDFMETRSGKYNKIPVEAPQDRSFISVSDLSHIPESFGTGAGKIKDAYFSDDAGNLIKTIVGDQLVCFNVRLSALKDIFAPSLTILIKDRNGKNIFTECTVDHFDPSDISMSVNTNAVVRFRFRFPVLVEGVYLVDLSLADGSKFDHAQVAWVYDILSLHVTKSLNVVGVASFNSLSLSWDNQPI